MSWPVEGIRRAIPRINKIFIILPFIPSCAPLAFIVLDIHPPFFIDIHNLVQAHIRPMPRILIPGRCVTGMQRSIFESVLVQLRSKSSKIQYIIDSLVFTA